MADYSWKIKRGIDMFLRNAICEDFDKIMEIYRYAQDFMIKSGNSKQWGYSYPDTDLIKLDIRKNACKVIYDENGVHGVFALFRDADPTYKYIEDGNWLNNEPYVTIHRLAGDGRVHGLFEFVSNYCKGISHNVRVDTHADNLIMQRLIEKNGFVKCGIIYVRDKTPRIAYHWTDLQNGISKERKSYEKE